MLFLKKFRLIMATLLMLGLGLTSVPSVQAAPEEALGETGTDPRDFSPKFMPYTRLTELENGIEQTAVTLFGMYAFDKHLAMTYEIPLAVENDFSDTPLNTGAGCPAVGGSCSVVGVGDMNLRFFRRTDWEALGGDWLYGVQIDFPIATDDALGGDTANLGPILVYVNDIPAWPGPGAFFALMNFYFFDIMSEDNAEDVSLYLGRWFVMLPLSAPGEGFFDGWYALPEFQPVYDFDDSHFSFWIGPEFGKMLSPGNLLYLKPGWGIDPDAAEGDREFTFEIGYRYFMD